MRKIGVKVATEQSQKELIRETVQDFVSVETKLFFTDEEHSDQFEKPVARIASLPQFLDNMLNQYDAAHLLTWHSQNIPENEIWLKLGGDHGKQSLKFTLEVANTATPNSQINTVVIGLVSVKDTYCNMKAFLETGLLNDINLLKTHVWLGKRIRLF